MYEPLYTPRQGKARIAQFMSGSGTNVVEVLKQEKKMGPECPYETVLIFTDNVGSNALDIADLYGVRFIDFDIRDFMEKRGLGRRLTLATPEHREARKEYSEKLEQIIDPYQTDYIVFGGFEPLINIRKPCLNVHPGDLTYLKDGKQYLTGLRTVPIQLAIDEELGYVRSCVIQAMPYTGAGEDMDNGPILGIGPKLLYEDERDPKTIQDKLKEVSDWQILPAVVLATALGEIAVDYELNRAENPVIMNLEYKMSEI
jgi:folate-dependent phosphoribosylglycinamide formyltransferase PurN